MYSIYIGQLVQPAAAPLYCACVPIKGVWLLLRVIRTLHYASCLGVAEIFDIFIKEVMIDLNDNKPAHGHHETVCSGWASATEHCNIYLYQQCILSGTELNRQVIAVTQAREYGALRKGLLDYHPSVFMYPRRTRVKMRGTLFDIYGQSLGDGKSILTSLKQNRSW